MSFENTYVKINWPVTLGLIEMFLLLIMLLNDLDFLKNNPFLEFIWYALMYYPPPIQT